MAHQTWDVETDPARGHRATVKVRPTSRHPEQRYRMLRGDWYNTGNKQTDYYLSQNELRERVRLLELTWEAAKWREAEGYQGREGVVVIYRGEVQGWVNELRDPSHWAPGCIAVDETGACWEATGGNEYDGATEWRQVRKA